MPMIFAQANAVTPAWLHQAWIFGVVILGLVVSPMVTVWLASRRQKREVIQGEEFVTKGRCDLLHAGVHQELSAVRADVVSLRARVDTVESETQRAIRELRQEILAEMAGMRGDLSQIIQAVGRLQGQLEGRRGDGDRA